MPEPDLRSRLLRIVEEYPGLHLRELQRRAGCSAMLAEYHLNVLEKLHLVTSTAHGRYRDFFPVRQERLALDRTDKRWLGLLRRPPILAVTLLLLEKGALRPLRVAAELELANSTAIYQVKTMTAAGLAVQDARDGRNEVRLADPERVLDLLRAYHPTPDALTDYANLWSRVFDRPRPAPTPPPEPEPPADLPEPVRGLRPAVQAVYLALRGGPLTQKEVCLETGHARRTVYGALRELEALGLLESRAHLLDTRQTKHWLRDAARGDADELGSTDSQDQP